MPNELARTQRRLLVLTASLVFAAIVALAFMVWRVVHNETRLAQEVDGAQRLAEKFQTMHEQFRVADTALRGYMLSGDEELVATYTDATKESQRQVEAIAELADLSAEERVQVLALRRFIDSRVEQGNQAIRIRRESGASAAVAIPIIERSEKATASAIAVLEHLIIDQQREMASAREKEARYDSLLRVFAFGMVGVTGVAAAVILWLRRWITKLQTSLVTVCAWTKRVRHGDAWLEFDVYLEKRFGVRVTHGMSEEIAAKLKSEIIRMDGE